MIRQESLLITHMHINCIKETTTTHFISHALMISHITFTVEETLVMLQLLLLELNY